MAEMITLYGRCGDALHRGSLNKFLRTKGVKDRIGIPEIIKWAQKFEDLLGSHVIVSADRKSIVWCVLRDVGHNKATTTVIMEHKEF